MLPLLLGAGLALAAPAAPQSCHPSPVFRSAGGFHDIRGVVRPGSVWALVFEPPRQLSPRRAEFAYRRQVKIAWHVTGSGPLRPAARGPGGTVAGLISGPDRHQSSSWKRPGREWGSVFSFPRPGCWVLTARTRTTRGEVQLLLRR